MKILVAVLMTALCVFAGATAWVDYVQPQLELVARAAQQKAQPEPQPIVKRKTRKVQRESDDELLPVPSDQSEPVAEASPKASRLRVAPASPTSEETQLLLKKQLDEVKDRESRIAARQDSLRMMYDDIRTELAMLDEIRKRASDELIAAERGKSDGNRDTTPSRQTATRPTTNEPAASLKGIAGTPANRAQALIMKRLVDDGNEDTAVSLLKAMKGREAANVLESLRSVAPRMAERLADSVPAMDNVPLRR